MRKALVGLFVLVLLGCAQPEQPQSAPDLILHNGAIYKMSWRAPAPDGTPARSSAIVPGIGWSPDASAVAIQDGRITGFGGEGILASRVDSTTVIDLQGATLLPGLVDSHVHLEELGAALEVVNLVEAETEAEAVELVTQRARTVPEGEWIIGWGWDEGAWADRYPTLDLLSERLPNHPVYLKGLHGFAVWGNRLALDKAGIDASTEAPSGGEIVLSPSGQPTGVFLNRARALLEDALPEPTQEQMIRRMSAGLEEMASSGFVAIHDAGLSRQMVEALQVMEDRGELPLRVYGMLSARDPELLAEWAEKGPDTDTDSHFRVRSVKAYYDGALGSRGARLLDDYSDQPGHRGVSGSTYGFDQESVRQIIEAGFQVGIHAIGDAGNRETLDFLESVAESDPDSLDLRHRIEHAQVVHPADFARFKSLRLIASMQPPHCAEDKTWAEERLGPERILGAYAWRTMRESGVPVLFNSDLPGSDHSFFYGLHSAVTRKDKEQKPDGGWYPDQALTVEEAIRAYTVEPAFASFLEDQTGKILLQRFADFTAIDVDPFRTAPEDHGNLLNGQVLMTIVGGKIVYRNPSLK